MRSTYFRMVCFILAFTVFFKINTNQVKVVKLAARCAVPIIKYGLPALPLVFLAIREGLSRFNRLHRVETEIREMHDDLDGFRDETGHNFKKTRSKIIDAKKEILQKVEKTKNTLKNLILKTDEHIGIVEKHIRGDVKNLKNIFMVKLKVIHKDIQKCATKGQMAQLERKLNTVSDQIKNYALLILKAIQDSKKDQKQHVKILFNTI